MKNKKEWNWDFIGSFLLSVLFFAVGLYLILNDKYMVGSHSKTQQYTAQGGEICILIGVIMLFVTYFTLHPFGKIRSFIDRIFNLKKNNK